MNYCLDCKHIKYDNKELIAARLIPNTKFEITCTKHHPGSSAKGAYKIPLKNNKNEKCFEPRPESLV